LLASGAANGVVKVWASNDASKRASFTCISTIDHSKFEGRPTKLTDEDEDADADPPQVYALQFINHWKGISNDDKRNSFLLSSSDDFVHLWDVQKKDAAIDLVEVLSIRFTLVAHMGYGVSVSRVTDKGLNTESSLSCQAACDQQETDASRFGGERNPDNLVFVFDASYCEGNGLLGVALSDGSVRLVNGRGVCVSVLTLPGCQSHLTALAWDKSGNRLASCVATGHLILWATNVGTNDSYANPTCEAVLEGGHMIGRPLYGAKYIGMKGEEEKLVVSWGVDGRLCLWDSSSQGNISQPIRTLLSQDDYPVYAVDVATVPTAAAQPDIMWRVAVGGGRDGNFLGIPVFLHDVKNKKEPSDQTV